MFGFLWILLLGFLGFCILVGIMMLIELIKGMRK
ncbi:hypothetical protein LCGC14_1505980 [marine sediment metagenome]|uniref:Uncharacterized protein n=1 Tax=marine sediment metagenome TaxID=412755 RepID=A0A0F9JNG6_9ZZZZ